MTTFTELPIELLLDNILPVMQILDILHLGATNQFFATVTSDETFWKRRLLTDYNFSGIGTARTAGWKLIYRGLFNPRIFVWGESSHGRLGLSRFPQTGLDGHVPFPTELCIPKVRIVSLVAGGMSFHALSSEGQIYVWGCTLDGTTLSLTSDGFSEPGKLANTPLRLQMPAPTRSISCGRLHASSLDSNNHIWTFPSWGRPFRLMSTIFNELDSRPLQIECGWAFSCVLTAAGDVYIWWPFSGSTAEQIQSANTEMDSQGDKKASVNLDNTIPCVTWDLDEDPVRLPSLPILPDLTNGDNEDKPTQLIQIAGLDAQLVGLTNKGHVLKLDCLQSRATSHLERWQYLPEFSQVERIQSQFNDLQIDVSIPSIKITHISANFVHFIAYSTGSSSVVLIGDTETNHESQPKIIPALQNRSVISVVLGDYHNAALTESGNVLTWGGYSMGALGLGDPTTMPPGSPGGFQSERERDRAFHHRRGQPPAVHVPTEVQFDHGRKAPKRKFCFFIAAAGWHTGALVIDLEPDDDNEDEIELVPEEGPLFPRDTHHQHGQTLPILPFGHRIGYAGRGWGLGRGATD